MLHFSGVPGSVRLTRAGSVAAVTPYGELGVLRHRRLQEQRGAVRVDPTGQDVDGHLARPTLHLGGIVRLRDRVVVDDAVEAAVLVLKLDPAADGAEVVAEVHLTRGLHPGEDGLHRLGWFSRVVVRGQAARRTAASSCRQLNCWLPWTVPTTT